ncbi:right-handed parallel beta-helix repeat-containing protein [Luteipulveratus mongoliensis]|uniref:right-handed parallel beta-helix repeat-containing protein n=1 Tax=Luteipulveratus mongoliensis TaxID=571913 RepID=UPI0009FA1D30|nr:right-handed parallel beta-helix repeat-containing protein [Luteipulveratus mongoliensis]
MRIHIALTLSLVAALALATAGIVSPGPAAARPRTVYVDCSGGSPGLHSLAEVNALTLRPGTQVLFKRGTRCVGTFAPRGAGAPGAPIRIGAYGSGARPVIDGNGAPDAVLLQNTQWIEVRDLEVTNAANPGGNRRGVHVRLSDYGTGRHYVLQNLYIHDIWGDDTKSTSGSDGILFSVVGDVRASAFDDVRVTGNTVKGVNRGGIRLVTSEWEQRPEVGSTGPVTKPWTANTRIVVSGNQVSDVGGDGIVILTARNALVEHNRIDGFQRRSAGYNAGMWPWNSDGTTFRYNEVSGGETTRDGMAFDVDQGTDRTVFEYNYSHDNAGGFVLLCNATGRVANAVVRYNVSQNDVFRGVEMCSGGIESAHVYNNTIYVGPGRSMTVINENTTAPHHVRFDNNIVVKTGDGTANLRLQPGTAVSPTHNTFVNVAGVESNPGGSTADPLLVAPGIGPAGYRLRAGSPATDAGTVIADNGGRDFYGNRVPRDHAPNIGAYEGRGVS